MSSTILYQLQPLPLSPKTLRRRAFEEERKKRIFDVRTRTIGVDIEALNSQCQEKAQMNQVQMQNSKKWEELNEARIRAEAELMRLQRERKTRQIKELMEFNASQVLLKSRCTTADSGKELEKPGVSSCQFFDGEDVDFQERMRRQREQMKVWCTQALYEQEEAKRREAEEKRLYELQQMEAQTLMALLNSRTALSRRTDNLQRATENLEMAAQKRERELRSREEELTKNLEEIQRMINSDLLCERPAGIDYKGMTAEEKETVLREQAEQRLEAELNRIKRETEELRQQMVDMALGRSYELQRREAERQLREKEKRLREENLRIAFETREKRQREKMDVRREGIDNSWWTTWNTDSR